MDTRDFSFNFNATKTYCYADSYDMVLRRDPYWENNKDGGRADSIGRTFYAYFCYPNNRFIRAIDSCWKRRYRRTIFGKTKYCYKGHRHPSLDPDLEGLSRDHFMYTIMAYKESGNLTKINEITRNMKWKISDFASFTIDSWLWVKAMTGCKIHTLLYEIILYPIILINMLWNKIVYKIGDFDQEMHQNEFYVIQDADKDIKSKKWAKKLYPTYALLIQAWQVYYLPDSILKRGIEKMLLSMTPRHNYVIQLLLRKKDVPKEDVYKYKMMTTGRWSSTLEPYINDRDLKIIDDPELLRYNRIEEDLVRKLYEEREEIH